MSEPRPYSLAQRVGETFWFIEPPPLPITVNWDDIQGKRVERGERGATGPQGPQGPPGKDASNDGLVYKTYPHAITDLSGSPVLDLDGNPIYGIDSIIDNPVSQVLIFETVSEMLGYPGHKIDKAVTLNWSGSDGNSQEWVMIADPRIVPNGDNEFVSNDNHGVLRSYTCRGESYGKQFATRDEVSQSVAESMPKRYQHNQGVPAATWIINHNLGRIPNIVIEDVYGRRILASTRSITPNQAEVSFAFARSGTAYIS